MLKSFSISVLILSWIYVPSAFCDTTEDSSFHAQVTAITQMHGEFSSPYSGKNSFVSSEPSATSYTLTLYLAKRFLKDTEFYLDPELAGGSGLSQTLGIAGYPNGEIYRVDSPNAKWNLSRLLVKRIFNIGEEKENSDASLTQLAGSVAVQSFTFIAGRFALNDYIDNNTYSHDPRIQFMNWALMDFGAWDYAADTRGFTWGILLEYNEKNWAVRYALAMVPGDANQVTFDSKFPDARGDNLEFETRYKVSDHPGVARILAFSNRAHMGSYQQSVSNPSYKIDITQTRDYRTKYGFGLNLEQEIFSGLGIFSRLSWNDGHEESWAFSEIDQSESFGASLKGTSWKRPHDTFASSVIVNHISGDHITYLNAGGYGFIIGDSKLSYNPEFISETYYSYEATPQIFLTLDYAYIANPAYNSDRGPVSIYGFRFHCEI